jgi:hypothetical protein
MSKQIDSAKLTTVDVKPYGKPTLVKGPVLGSVTALTKNISGFQPPAQSD